MGCGNIIGKKRRTKDWGHALFLLVSSLSISLSIRFELVCELSLHFSSVSHHTTYPAVAPVQEPQYLPAVYNKLPLLHLRFHKPGP